MKGDTVFQGHYAQISIQFRDEYPMTDTIIFGLNFPVNRVFYRCGTPFKTDIRALRKHIVPKVLRHGKLGHFGIRHWWGV